MARTDRLAKLFHAIAAGDLLRAEKAASEICAEEEGKGHHAAARLLRGAICPNGSVSGNSTHRAGKGAGHSLLPSAALSELPRSVGLSDVVLTARSKKQLEEFVTEWEHRLQLKERGLRPRTKLFFYGPPGCGKSLTARALGRELALPVYLVRFDAVIGAYLGQTAVHLRQLFQFAEQTPCLLLFDELDALGKKRGSPLDVGELDRIVISLMQELEHSDPRGVIVATSNLSQNLDDALWRRFDLVVEFPKPTKAALVRYGAQLAKARGLRAAAQLKNRILTSKSYADAERLIEDEARRAVLRKT